MDHHDHHAPGFFPNLLSVGIFAGIVFSLFIGFTRFYPLFLQQQHPIPSLPKPALLVSGGLLGVNASVSTSRRVSGPLHVNQILGYRHGIRVALLTSLDWYDLDRQLFRSRGLVMGTQAAMAQSKTLEERGTRAYQVQLIDQITVALNTDLDALLSGTNLRAETLQDFLERLHQLRDEGAIELGNLERILAEATLQLEQSRSISDQAMQTISPEVDGALTPGADLPFDQYLAAQKDVDIANLTLRTTDPILKRLKPLVQRLDTFTAGIEANKEALAAGIKITPVKGLPLTKP